MNCIGPLDQAADEKKEFTMFNRNLFTRQFAVFAAALLMSTIAVGAAVGPGATASVQPLVAATYA